MKKIFLIICFGALVFACKEEVLDLKGTIAGKVVLAGTGGVRPEGSKVVLENEFIQTETYTDAEGFYHFDDVDQGVYSLTFSYQAYGTYQLTNYPFIGFGKNAVIEETSLYKIPDINFKEVQLSLSGGVNGYTILDGYITLPQVQSRYFVDILLFFDKKSDVNGKKYTYKSTYDYYSSKWTKGDQYDTLHITDFIHELPKGEDWYVGVYVKSTSDHDPPTTLKKAHETLQLKVQ